MWTAFLECTQNMSSTVLSYDADKFFANTELGNSKLNSSLIIKMSHHIIKIQKLLIQAELG